MAIISIYGYIAFIWTGPLNMKESSPIANMGYISKRLHAYGWTKKSEPKTIVCLKRWPLIFCTPEDNTTASNLLYSYVKTLSLLKDALVY